MTTIKHTADLDALFFLRLEGVAKDLGASPRDMLAVMMSESGVKAAAHNNGPPGAPYEKQYHASGLIQFMPFILPGVGWTRGHEEFRKLSATDQLSYVKRYYAPHKGNLGSVGGLYVATFLPALTKHAGDPSFILTAKNGPLGWAYAPNAVFDRNGDFAITVGELEDAVRRNCTGARWAEIMARLATETGFSYDPPPEPVETFDLGTTRGLQEALSRLGHDPGAIDGIPGPKTTGAVVAFQVARGLKPDGIPGPLTRAALAMALATAA